MKGKISIGGFVFFCVCTGVHCFAQELQKLTPVQPLKSTHGSDSLITNVNPSRNHLIEIDRLIVDETLSKAGFDFLELFQAKWAWPTTLKESFQIVVAERPFRGITTQVVIYLNDLIVFESFLQTRYDVLESLAEAATEQTLTYLMNYESIMQQLEGDDTIGNGIY